LGEIRSLKFLDCFDANDSFKSLDEFREMGIPVTPATWLLLRGSLHQARNALKKPDPEQDEKIN
jgi:hypothetical protein